MLITGFLWPFCYRERIGQLSETTHGYFYCINFIFLLEKTYN